jgi:hypothetical protein
MAGERKVKERFGGVAGNRALTTGVAIVLLVLLPVELLTLLALGQLLSVHVFVGMLLVPIAALKLGSVAYRFGRYYLRDPAYRAAGAPPLLLRALGPLVVVTTLGLLGSGVLLVALGRHTPYVLTVHKASFVLWAGAMGLHVLGHLREVARTLLGWIRRPWLAGRGVRALAIGTTLLAGLVLATETLPLIDHWQDRVTHERHDVR